jgi:AP endonuclease-1
MSDSDGSALSSARSDILEAPVPAITSTANGNKKRKREITTVESTGAATKKSRTKPENSPAKKSKEVARSTQTTPLSKKAKAKVEVKNEVDIEIAEAAPKATPRQTKKSTKEIVKVEEAGSTGEVKVKVQRKRKTKEEKEAEAMPLAARTLGAKVLVGAHVSSAGGVHNAVMNSIHIGGNAFALFLKSQRKWENPPLQDEHLSGFISGCKSHKYGHHDHTIPPIVPHGSYVLFRFRCFRVAG